MNKKEKKDKCVSCGVDTQYDEFDHIDSRHFYIEGAGQLCCDCYDSIYNVMSTQSPKSIKYTGD